MKPEAATETERDAELAARVEALRAAIRNPPRRRLRVRRKAEPEATEASEASSSPEQESDDK